MRIAGSLGLVAVSSLLSASAHADPTPANGLTNPLVPPDQACQNCHGYPNADEHGSDPLYAPYFGWAGSMMANAARDPVFWAGVAIADQDEPGGTVDCIRCHSPRAFLEGRGDAIAIDELQPSDFDGVTCETCHRLLEDPGTPPGNARYQIDDVMQGGIVPRRGPWNYPGPFTPAHAWIEDPYVGTSRACGTCHDVTTPRERVDDDGTPMGIAFNEQRTYSEWANSSFAVDGPDFRSCQDCHMPAVADMPGCQDAVNTFSHPTGGRRHDLVGANRFMLQLLDQEYGTSRGSGDVPSALFALSTDRTDELVATAATLEVTAPAEVSLDAGLEGLEVTVTNNTGHKLPSGYSEGRVMWIEVVATYGDTPVWSSGAWTQGVGFQRDDQVRTYQAVAEEYASGATFHLLRNDHWVEDTRIPPAGLVADVQTDPVGERYAMRGDGTWPNFDVAPYTFPPTSDIADATPDDATDDVLNVSVRLLYVINTPQYVQFLADENSTNDAGNHVATLFEAAGGAEPLVLAQQDLQIPITGFGAVGTTGNADDTAGPDTTGNPNTSGPPSSTGIVDDDTMGTETDPGENDDGGGGCSCRAGDRTGATPAGWLMLLGLVAWRRRRTRG